MTRRSDEDDELPVVFLETAEDATRATTAFRDALWNLMAEHKIAAGYFTYAAMAGTPEDHCMSVLVDAWGVTHGLTAMSQIAVDHIKREHNAAVKKLTADAARSKHN